MKKLAVSLAAIAFTLALLMTSASAETYEVEKGDNLWNIAETYDIEVIELMHINRLDSSIIHPEQILDISDELEEAKDNQSNDDKASKSDEGEKEKSGDESENPEGETLSLEATAYTASCEGCSGVTHQGTDLDANPDEKVIAVDPDVIPLGSEVYVEGYGYATADDIGGDIKGNRIDVFIPSEEDALDFGRQSVDVTIVE